MWVADVRVKDPCATRSAVNRRTADVRERGITVVACLHHAVEEQHLLCALVAVQGNELGPATRVQALQSAVNGGRRLRGRDCCCGSGCQSRCWSRCCGWACRLTGCHRCCWRRRFVVMGNDQHTCDGAVAHKRSCDARVGDLRRNRHKRRLGFGAVCLGHKRRAEALRGDVCNLVSTKHPRGSDPVCNRELCANGVRVAERAGRSAKFDTDMLRPVSARVFQAGLCPECLDRIHQVIENKGRDTATAG